MSKEHTPVYRTEARTDYEALYNEQKSRAEAAEARVRELEKVPRNMRLVTESELDAVRRDVEDRTIERCKEAVADCFSIVGALHAIDSLG